MTEQELLQQLLATTGPIGTILIGGFLWLRAILSALRKDVDAVRSRADTNHDRLTKLEAQS